MTQTTLPDCTCGAIEVGLLAPHLGFCQLNQICVCGAVLWSVECRKRGHLGGPQPRDEVIGAARFGLIGSNETDHGPDGFPL